MAGAASRSRSSADCGCLSHSWLVCVRGGQFAVVGSGAVYVVDGEGVTRSNIAEAGPDRVLSMYDVRLHVLSAGDAFDLAARRLAGRPKGWA